MTSSWMADFPNSALKDLAIPMTHDAATAALSKYTISPAESGYDIGNPIARISMRNFMKTDTIKNFARKIATTQNESRAPENFLVDQAYMGVRAFDLRIFCGEQSVLYQHGTVVWRLGVLESFARFAQYLRARPLTEVYIFLLSHFRGPANLNIETYNFLATGISDIFAGLICHDPNWRTTPISQLAATPVIMLIDPPQKIAGAVANLGFMMAAKYYNDDYPRVKQMGVSMNPESVMRYISARLADPAVVPITDIQAHLQFEMPGGFEFINNTKSIDIRYMTEKSRLNYNILQLLMGADFVLGTVSFDFYTADMTAYFVAINKKNIEGVSAATEPAAT